MDKELEYSEILEDTAWYVACNVACNAAWYAACNAADNAAENSEYRK